MSRILTISKYDAVLCKNQSKISGLLVIIIKQKSNTIEEFGICYSASHVLQSLPQASPLPSGSQALIKLSLPNISNHMKHPHVFVQRKAHYQYSKVRRNTITVKVAQEVQQRKVIFLG